MPNKKNKNSRYTGFYWYMQEMMPRLKKEGRIYGGIDAVVPVARPMWKAMSKHEQDRYEKIAKEMKRKEQNNLFGLPKYRDDSQRLDNVGNIIADRIDHVEAKKETRAKDRKWAKSKWPLQKEGMMDVKFYFVGFEYLCMLEDGCFLPCEVALLEWSMKSGITKTFHRFIDTGGIPMGYRFTCQQHSDETHQIPIERFELADNNYRDIWLQMENFVNPTGEARDFPPLYCAEAEWKGALSMIDWLHGQACIPRGNCLNNVFVLEDCVQDLAGMACQSISDGGAANVLLTSVFDYEANTRCKWHEEKEVKNCGLGTVKRYAYAISDFLSGPELYNFPTTKNHLPTRDPKFDQTIYTIPSNRVYVESSNLSTGRDGGNAWADRKRREEEEYNGVFPARDIRYKQEKVIIDPNEDDDEDEDDLESMYSYSSRQTSLSNFSSDKYKPQRNNPNYKPNIIDDEEFPSLGLGGAVKPKAANRTPAAQQVGRPSQNGHQNGLGSWQPSAAYLEERNKREQEIANKPSLMDIVRSREIESQEKSAQNPVKLLAGGVRAPESVPMLGRGRGNPQATAGSNPWMQSQPCQGVWGGKAPAAVSKPVSMWSQGAQRSVSDNVQQPSPLSFAGVGRGRGRGSWVPRAEPEVGSQQSEAVTRPPPGFGRGFLNQQMGDMSLGD